jgi:hypothetical protein
MGDQGKSVKYYDTASNTFQPPAFTLPEEENAFCRIERNAGLTLHGITIHVVHAQFLELS